MFLAAGREGPAAQDYSVPGGLAVVVAAGGIVSVVVDCVVVVDVSVPVAGSVVVVDVDSSFVVCVHAAMESEATTKAAAVMVRSVAFIGTSLSLARAGRPTGVGRPELRLVAEHAFVRTPAGGGVVA